MKIVTIEEFIPKEALDLNGLQGLRQCYSSYISKKISSPHRVTKFVITKSDDRGYYCEIDSVLFEKDEKLFDGNIFDFRKKTHENTDKFTAVLLIPTGIGAEIGGHCGDGNPVARLLASACDTLITHPNVVNASDINEMTENTEYVEGSILSRFLLGKVGLQKVKSNRVLMLMDKHKETFFNEEVINAVSSARITLGLDCDVYEMNNLVQSTSKYSGSGRATGEVNDLEKLLAVIEKFKDKYDAIGLSTFIKVPAKFHKDYFSADDMVNPWGGIEAMLTHSISEAFNMPCAHSPMMTSSEIMELELGVVDPRKAPESASTTYLHCILKGLYRSPKIVEATKGITLEDVSCVIIPDGCIGLPTLACLENDIPLIVVKGNKNLMKNDLNKLPFKKNKLFFVDNYLEAAGVMTALKAGVSLDVIKRPVGNTTIL